MEYDKRKRALFLRTIYPLRGCGNAAAMAVFGSATHRKYAKYGDSEKAYHKKSRERGFHVFAA